MQSAVAIIPYDDMWRMATAIHKSGMFNLKTPEAAISLFLLAQAEGLHPMTALRRFHILSDGRASMRSDAMLADFRMKAGGTVKWLRHDHEAAVGLWKVGDYELQIGFTIEEARAAGYVKPGSGWMKDPGAMLRARCISRAIRMMAPEVVAGLYTPEELSDGDWAPVPTVTAPSAPTPALNSKTEGERTEALALKAPASPAAEPDRRPWKDILGDKEQYAINYLVVHGWLREGEGLHQLKDAHSARIRKNPAAFLMAVDKEANMRQTNAQAVEDATLTAAQKAVRDVLGGKQ